MLLAYRLIHEARGLFYNHQFVAVIGLAVLASACTETKQRQFTTLRRTETFAAAKLLKKEIQVADMFFIVDDSGSMAANQTKLANSMEEFATYIARQLADVRIYILKSSDYRIGLTGEPGAPASWPSEPEAISNKNEDGSRVDVDTFVQQIKNKISSIGTTGSGAEMPLNSFHRFVTDYPEKANDPKRKDATKIIVVLTDEDDQSMAVQSDGTFSMLTPVAGNYTNTCDPMEVLGYTYTLSACLKNSVTRLTPQNLFETTLAPFRPQGMSIDQYIASGKIIYLGLSVLKEEVHALRAYNKTNLTPAEEAGLATAPDNYAYFDLNWTGNEVIDYINERGGKAFFEGLGGSFTEVFLKLAESALQKEECFEYGFEIEEGELEVHLVWPNGLTEFIQPSDYSINQEERKLCFNNQAIIDRVDETTKIKMDYKPSNLGQ